MARWQICGGCEATCAISCASLMDGMVVLEDVPLFKNERGGFMFRADDHVKQFERSAKIAQIELPHASSKLAKAALKVAKASVANGVDKGIVRFVAYFGGAASTDGLLSLGGQASVAIFCMPFSGEVKSILREAMRAPVAATRFPTPTGRSAMTKALIWARAVCRAPIPKWPPRESPRGVRFRATRCRRKQSLPRLVRMRHSPCARRGNVALTSRFF
mgnify:CR=1 FL=1